MAGVEQEAARPARSQRRTPRSVRRADHALAGRALRQRPGTLGRELEVLRLLARGASSEDVATELGISAETVRSHVKNASHKLGARTRIHAVTLAIASGWISLPDLPPD